MSRESLRSTTRFTDRVDAYVRSRPGYPPALFAFLASELGLHSDHTIVDVGSGTGLLARPFLERGNRVLAVEPNDAMRAAAEAALGSYSRFTSVSGTAEETGLAAGSADFVVAGQAFHWFDPEAAAGEIGRVLAPGGWAVLVWNHRRPRGTPFLEAYEAFLRRWGTDYETVAARHADPARLERFFNEGRYQAGSFPNEQWLDEEGLEARIASSSYMPAAGHPDHASMQSELLQMFVDHGEEGRVRIAYDTLVFWGRV